MICDRISLSNSEHTGKSMNNPKTTLHQTNYELEIAGYENEFIWMSYAPKHLFHTKCEMAVPVLLINLYFNSFRIDFVQK